MEIILHVELSLQILLYFVAHGDADSPSEIAGLLCSFHNVAKRLALGADSNNAIVGFLTSSNSGTSCSTISD